MGWFECDAEIMAWAKGVAEKIEIGLFVVCFSLIIAGMIGMHS